MDEELPDYARKILESFSRGDIQPGSVAHVTVTHADDCPFWRGERCNCGPAVTIIPAEIKGGLHGE